MSEQQEDTLIKAPAASEFVSDAVLRASVQMGLKGSHLAQIIGTSPATISRMRSGAHFLKRKTKSYELALVLLRLHRSLMIVMREDVDAVKTWMTSYNDELADVPARKILTAHGLVNVLARIEMRATIAAG